MIIPPNASSTSLFSRAISAPTEDKSNIITIVTWATLILSVLAFLARQCIKFARRREVRIDDLFILVAMVCAVGLSVTVLILASDGLGVLQVLTLRRANMIMKSYYASDFLYIATLAFAKLSLISFFYSAHHQRPQRLLILAIGIFISAWTLASIAAVAFQCGLPRPWEVFTLHCFSTGIFWIVFCIIDMTTDVAIIMLSVNLVAYLKVPLSRKIGVVACFAPRIFVIGFALARLIFLYPISPHNRPEYNLWIPLILTQVQACLSIVTACIPYVRPFLETADLGLWRRSQSGNEQAAANERAYGCCSLGYLRGYKKAQDNSAVSTSSMFDRTPDVSPRIETPVPLSPLEPPRLNTPPNTAEAASDASSSHRGLRLNIPSEYETQVEMPIVSPRTESSFALSPSCLSPRPMLSFPQQDGSISPAIQDSRRVSQSPSIAVSAPLRPRPPRRFSLFPSQQPQYSPLPQNVTKPSISIPTPVTERSPSDSVTPVRDSSPHLTPETRRPPPPDAVVPNPSPPRLQYPPQTSSSLERLVYEDPLRITTEPTNKSPAVSAPAPAAMPATHNNRTLIPPAYARSPPVSHKAPFSVPQLVSYHHHTASTVMRSQNSSPPPNPYAHNASPALHFPSSPQRQRNNRVLTPQNSSRRDQMSPVSPVSPPTPLTFWRDESTQGSAGTERSPGGWEEAHMMPIVRDVRNSPRIVVQRFE